MTLIKFATKEYLQAMLCERSYKSPHDAEFEDETQGFVSMFKQLFESQRYLGYIWEEGKEDWLTMSFMYYALNFIWYPTKRNKVSCPQLDKGVYGAIYSFLLTNRDLLQKRLDRGVSSFEILPDPAEVVEADNEMLRLSSCATGIKWNTRIAEISLERGRKWSKMSHSQYGTPVIFKPSESATEVVDIEKQDEVKTETGLEPDVSVTVGKPADTSKEPYKLMWISRHVLQHGQTEAIKKAISVDKPLSIYHYEERVTDILSLVNVIKKVNPDGIFVVLPDDMLITLKVLLQDSNIDIYKQAPLAPSKEISVMHLDKDGTVVKTDKLYQFSGWVKVTGGTAVTQII